MAVGAITPKQADVSGGAITVIGDLRCTVNNVVPTSGANYAVGGVPVTAAQLGLSVVLWAVAQVITQAATVGPSEVAVIPQADGSVLLKCLVAAGTGDNGANANLSATLVQVVAFGY